MADIDQAAAAYQQTCEGFEELYAVFNQQYGGQYRYELIAHQTGADVHDVQAAYEDALLDCLRLYKPGRGAFRHYLARSLFNARTSLYRDGQRQQAIPYAEIASGTTGYIDGIEADIIEAITDTDFRCKIEQATARYGPEMLEALALLLEGLCVQQAAKRAGVYRQTVKRRLAKIVAAIA